MKDYELEKIYSQLTENEKDILFNGISLEAARILYKILPSRLIQTLIDIKSE